MLAECRKLVLYGIFLWVEGVNRRCCYHLLQILKATCEGMHLEVFALAQD